MIIKGPNFFIVGAPKCGTTALYSYLGTHPDVFFPTNAKEPHYYNEDMPGFRWFSDAAKYAALFASDTAQAARIRGEASVQYLYSNMAAKAIARDVPDARILVCLRSPVPFIRSYHNQMLTNLDEDIVDLGTAWRASETPREVAREPQMLDYKSVGLFSVQIDRYRAVFPDRQIRLLMLEEFATDPCAYYRALLEWLGLDDDGRSNFARVHEAAAPRSRWLSGVLKSPPPWLHATVGALKSSLGLSSLGLARILANVNLTSGYASSKIDVSLAQEITDHFAQDQRALERHADLFLHSAEPSAGVAN